MIHQLLKATVLVAGVLSISSCANYKLHIAKDAQPSSDKIPNPTSEIIHTLYLIGDAGLAGKESKNATVALFQQHLNKAKANSTALFLGDNIYPAGLPPQDESPLRKEAEKHLDAQIKAVEDYVGRPIFIPGNHDWNDFGVAGLNRQEQYIETALNKGIDKKEDWKNYFLPDNGCPGPEVIELADNLVLLLMDSEWWLEDWEKDPQINTGCEINSRERFAELVNQAIEENKDKEIIIACHHAFRSNGPHGGHSRLKYHLFPFSVFSENLYIPLPAFGTILMGIRRIGITKQDIANGKNKKLANAIVQPAIDNGEFIFVGGHEHTLQYIRDNGQHFIVSGAGSKVSPTVGGGDALFSYGHNGFAIMNFYKDGSSWVEFWVPVEGQTEGEMVFRHQVKGSNLN